MTELTEFERRLAGYSLVTANIIYRMPDYRLVLQEFIWQKLDLAPKYPELRKFLDFWEAELDGPIHSVTVASTRLIRPSEFHRVDDEIVLH